MICPVFKQFKLHEKSSFLIYKDNFGIEQTKAKKMTNIDREDNQKDSKK